MESRSVSWRRWRPELGATRAELVENHRVQKVRPALESLESTERQRAADLWNLAMRKCDPEVSCLVSPVVTRLGCPRTPVKIRRPRFVLGANK